LCNTLSKQYPNKHFVPVFWQGSEDHDFAEINHAHIFNKTFTWETDQRGATGRFSLHDIAPLVQELISMLGDGTYAEEMRAILEDAYLQSETLAESGRKMLNALFGRFGLVVVNGDDPYAKSVFAGIIQEELTTGSSAKLVQSTLAQFPYPPQANPRDINLFYLSAHGRDRIIADPQHQQFEVKDTDIKFTREQLMQEVNTHPERFSPNVILRPVFQQKLLPAIAFIGGGGEVAYWLQLKSLFEHHQVQFPMILVRDSFMLVDQATGKKLQKLQLDITELFEEEHMVISDYVRRNSGESLQFDAERAAIESILEGLKAKARAIDNSLDSAVMAEGQSMLNSLQKLEAKLLKAEKAKMEVQLTQLKGILNKLFPGGGLQERYDNMIPWYLKYGPSLIDSMVANATQPNGTFHVLSEELS
jgi:bacillithiol biosynthesis cysteine-adding enzyme BshC